eukprot:CAMPEP_0181179420 /NCGR_PEP_ID=MMETSP1096-20121128/6252_1 /TAXON_ID=156174 ORGANISM="Chrysochromulina ericina, Strain CCMP281" /NCGR_SAMPLE_ID=MMETSP1096 /ASSEMBLY_ACC=CAM_ASM_000453 /LENGTH=184 /DNA_ID=CAMNT_0023267771 /DNA_START=259 /DNA_END=813 /DNA_ORIENTATION=-
MLKAGIPALNLSDTLPSAPRLQRRHAAQLELSKTRSIAQVAHKREHLVWPEQAQHSARDKLKHATPHETIDSRRPELVQRRPLSLRLNLCLGIGRANLVRCMHRLELHAQRHQEGWHQLRSIFECISDQILQLTRELKPHGRRQRQRRRKQLLARRKPKVDGDRDLSGRYRFRDNLMPPVGRYE